MSRGRPRKPTEQHILEGTFRPDRHGDILGKILPTGSPDRPPELEGHAAKLWDVVVTELAAHGVAKHIDTVALAEMCQWYARYRKVADEFDGMSPRSRGANKMLNQMLGCWREFERCASKFGLSPADRAKLNIVDAPTRNDGVMVRRRA